MTPEKQSPHRLSLENALHIVVCLGFFALFTGLALRPVCHRYETLRTRIRQEQCRLARCAVLDPFEAELVAELNLELDEALHMTKGAALDREDFEAIHALLEDLAEGCGLQLLKTAPHASSLGDKGRFLGVNMTAEGPFAGMRGFLQAVMQMPSFYHLERLQISESVQAERLEAQVWLCVK
jgi:hypothetical protein